MWPLPFKEPRRKPGTVGMLPLPFDGAGVIARGGEGGEIGVAWPFPLPFPLPLETGDGTAGVTERDGGVEKTAA